MTLHRKSKVTSQINRKNLDASVRPKFRTKTRENKERNSANFALITFAQYCNEYVEQMIHQKERGEGSRLIDLSNTFRMKDPQVS